MFIVTRIREEWERTGDNTEAVALGLARTGGVVTSAATIMVAIFASFLLVVVPEMKQMGFGLAVAVLLDATIVRAMLVPAFMRIAGRWKWCIHRLSGRRARKPSARAGNRARCPAERHECTVTVGSRRHRGASAPTRGRQRFSGSWPQFISEYRHAEWRRPSAGPPCFRCRRA